MVTLVDSSNSYKPCFRLTTSKLLLFPFRLRPVWGKKLAVLCTSWSDRPQWYCPAISPNDGLMFLWGRVSACSAHKWDVWHSMYIRSRWLRVPPKVHFGLSWPNRQRSKVLASNNAPPGTQPHLIIVVRNCKDDGTDGNDVLTKE